MPADLPPKLWEFDPADWSPDPDDWIEWYYNGWFRWWDARAEWAAGGGSKSPDP